MDPTERFSNRVENYINFRPGYPQEVAGLLESECGLTRSSVIADVGSGTGILSEMFLKIGCSVFGVEPNAEMRRAGERLLAGYSGFTSVAATAEASTLADKSVDFVTAGQAFHWFKHNQSRDEFARILKPGGWVVLIWNSRRDASTPFLAAYEDLLKRYGTDYEMLRHRNIGHEELRAFFAPNSFTERTFENSQQFDFEGLTGRLLSSSYAPASGHPNHEPMVRALHEIFDRHQEGGKVCFEYDTEVYYGRLAEVAAP